MKLFMLPVIINFSPEKLKTRRLLGNLYDYLTELG
jgi:hypothetical protein